MQREYNKTWNVLRRGNKDTKNRRWARWHYVLFVLLAATLMILKQTEETHAFEYYVLSLSWSPTFCQDKGGTHSTPEQCSKNMGYGLVVHGLWPQEENGWPEFCESEERFDITTADPIRPAMPSEDLVRHQWKKHGTCSGLSQTEYFDTTKKAAALLKYPNYLLDPSEPKITSPKEVMEDLYALNPSLPDGAVKLTCRNERLTDIRLCLTKNLTPRRCGARAGLMCSSRRLVLPAAR